MNDSTKNVLKWALLCVSLGASACSADGGADGHSDRASAEIVGGEIDPGDPAVVHLLGQTTLPGSSQQTQSTHCTGSLIAPTVILTAAHCAKIFDQVTRRARFEVGTEPETWIELKEFHVDPQFDPGRLDAGHDIALAILAQPATVTPIRFNRSPLTDAMIGQPVRLIGYGYEEDFFGEAGIKRQAQVTLDAFTDVLLEDGNVERHTAEGDSGGPALMMVDGVESIVGTLSFGHVEKWQVSKEYHTRVDRYLDFIDPFIR
jgi:hypothetical protein